MAERQHYFLKLDGISGDSKDPDHAGWIDVDAFHVPRSESHNNGGGSGKAHFQDIVLIVSSPGRHSPLLQQASNAGWPIKSGILEIVRGTRCTRTVSLRVRFTDLLVSTYQSFPGNPPREEFSLSFGGVRFEPGSPPPAAQTVRPVSRLLIRPAAIQ